MGILALWFLSYFVPAFATTLVLFATPRYKPGAVARSVVVHTGLLASILVSHTAILAANLSFPWGVSVTSGFLFAASVTLAYVVLGRLGLFYVFSALLQQLTMLSVAFILFPYLPLFAVALLDVPIYAFSHLL